MGLAALGMLGEELPEKFDCVLVGTGLTESLVAAAVARAGKSVLHLDRNPFYGSRNATLNLQDLIDFLHSGGAAAEEEQPGPAPTPNAVLVERMAERPTHVSYVAAEAPPAAALAVSHRYNLDLTPQLLLSAGTMVESLRSSGVASYIEFKPLQGFLYGEGVAPAAEGAPEESTHGSGDSATPWLRRVPCGKADIFQSADIPLIQKRQLMKFLQACTALQAELEPGLTQRPQVRASPDAAPTATAATAATDGSFLDFVGRQRLAPALADMMLYSILQLPAPPSTAAGNAAPMSIPSAADGLRAINRHLRSLGVYGATAYLACVYGSSEMPQGFCRLCAVWGGVYMLNSGALSLDMSEDGSQVAAVIGPQDGKRIECAHVVLNGDSRILPKNAPQSVAAVGSGVSRCVCVLDGPLLAASTETPAAQAAPATAIFFPPKRPDGGRVGSTVYALQMDAEAGVCPKGQVVLHLSATSQDGVTPEALLRPVLDALLSERAAAAAKTRGASDAAGGGKEDADAAKGAQTLPSAFIESALPTRAEYEASLAWSTEERLAAEGAAAARHARAAAEQAASADDAHVLPDVSVVWGAFFELPLRSCLDAVGRDACPANVHACDDVSAGVDCEAHVARAREIFERICPGEPFFPSAEQEEEEEESTEAAAA